MQHARVPQTFLNLKSLYLYFANVYNSKLVSKQNFYTSSDMLAKKQEYLGYVENCNYHEKFYKYVDNINDYINVSLHAELLELINSYKLKYREIESELWISYHHSFNHEMNSLIKVHKNSNVENLNNLKSDIIDYLRHKI